MAQRIELKCKCGSTIVLEDSRGNYINPGGSPDAKGRVFTIQVQADSWLDRHAPCHALARSVPA